MSTEKRAGAAFTVVEDACWSYNDKIDKMLYISAQLFDTKDILS